MNVEDTTKKLLKNMNLDNIGDLAKKDNILIQELLREMVLTYLVDIREQTKNKHDDITTTYPLELISSLKIISELYFKFKSENKNETIKSEKDAYSKNYIYRN